MAFQNAVPVDVGDGIMHFYISQASWLKPELFLHHWGKPFFILLSSGFAQFGLNGVVVFNVLVFFFTCLFAFKIADKKEISNWITALFPLLLLQASDYTSTVLAGLTEPLFNLALMASFLLFIHKKFLWFAVLVSLMPFMRSEGQLPLMLAVIMLIIHKQYRVLPFLASGFIVCLCRTNRLWRIFLVFYKKCLFHGQ